MSHGHFIGPLSFVVLLMSLGHIIVSRSFVVLPPLCCSWSFYCPSAVCGPSTAPLLFVVILLPFDNAIDPSSLHCLLSVSSSIHLSSSFQRVIARAVKCVNNITINKNPVDKVLNLSRLLVEKTTILDNRLVLPTVFLSYHHGP